MLSGHIVLVGYGRVGRRLGEALLARGIPVVVADQNRDIVEELRGRDVPAVCGDAAEPGVLIQAHIARAQMLVIAAPDTLRARRMIETARTLRPSIKTLARVYSEEDAEVLRKASAGGIFQSEHELALSMMRHVLQAVDAEREDPSRSAVEPDHDRGG